MRRLPLLLLKRSICSNYPSRWLRQLIADQFNDAELEALRALIERYFDIEDYGWQVWGRRFYERLYLIRSKIDEALGSVSEGDLYKDDFTYIDLKILLNMVLSEGLGWAIGEAPTRWYFRSSNVPVTSENRPGLVIGIIMMKLQKRIERQR